MDPFETVDILVGAAAIADGGRLLRTTVSGGVVTFTIADVLPDFEVSLANDGVQVSAKKMIDAHRALWGLVRSRRQGRWGAR